ncbi:SDR family NAD(P)-dependent oxidoreductase [Gordonia sp. SL306]|uniref:SDR family NAD(P)-dependent oxidoreductase n=1 Tax=Gordonia sp. SL306 TaxID=2995145 RepID=UPI0022713FCC|nr:SDR family NAD(P)-dependent oxidoreductase [Gordonia sp. SL306]WAC54285.1 SDR family NAD(P)-dependent oxidoreductase [Gordonia sp. SL306]
MTGSDSPRVALVTGGGQGLGLAMARRLAADGLEIVIADIDAARTDQAAAEVSGTAMVLDVTDDRSVRRGIDAVADRFGRLDVLINNAGIISRSNAEEIDSDRWLRELDVHLGGTMRCSRQAFPLLREAPAAAIVNLASVGSTFGLPHRLAYTAAKSGVTGITRTLAAEWGPYGIRVNAVAPGYIDTGMMRSGLESGTLDEDRLLDRTPLRRFGLPEEIASATSFLVSADASFVTGTVLRVDGGITIDGTFHSASADLTREAP